MLTRKFIWRIIVWHNINLCRSFVSLPAVFILIGQGLLMMWQWMIRLWIIHWLLIDNYNRIIIVMKELSELLDLLCILKSDPKFNVKVYPQVNKTPRFLKFWSLMPGFIFKIMRKCSSLYSMLGYTINLYFRLQWRVQIYWLFSRKLQIILFIKL